MAAKGPKPPTPEELLLADAQRLTSLWLEFRNSFAKAVGEEPLSREDEQAFLGAKTEISKLQRSLAQKMPPGIQFGVERLNDLLRQSISVGHLRALPKADRLTLLATWHYVFVYLSQATGALQFIAEGYKYDPATRVKKAGVGMAELKGAAGSKKEAKKKPVALIAIILIGLIGAAVYFVMNQ